MGRGVRPLQAWAADGAKRRHAAGRPRPALDGTAGGRRDGLIVLRGRTTPVGGRPSGKATQHIAWPLNAYPAHGLWLG